MDLEENYASGQDLFRKLSRTELVYVVADRLSTAASKVSKNLVVILVPTSCGVVIVTCALVCLSWRRFTRRGRRMNSIGIDKSLVEDDFPLFSFATMKLPQTASLQLTSMEKADLGLFIRESCQTVMR